MEGRELTGKGKVETFFGRPGRLMKKPVPVPPARRKRPMGQQPPAAPGGCVDDLTVIRSMVAKSSNHTPATFQMNSGFTMNGFPCLGAWLSYGLGTREPGPADVRRPARPPRAARPAGRSTGRRVSCRPPIKASHSARPASRSWTSIRPRAGSPGHRQTSLAVLECDESRIPRGQSR